MSYSISYNEQPDCIRMGAEGALDPSVFRNMAQDVAQAIKKYPRTKILNDLRNTENEHVYPLQEANYLIYYSIYLTQKMAKFS